MPALPPGRAPAKMRSLRVPDAVWDKAKRKSAKEGRHLSETVVDLLRAYNAGQVSLPPVER